MKDWQAVEEIRSDTIDDWPALAMHAALAMVKFGESELPLSDTNQTFNG